MNQTVANVKDFKAVVIAKIESENSSKAATVALSDELCRILDIDQLTLSSLYNTQTSIRLPNLKVHLNVERSAIFNWKYVLVVSEYFPNMTEKLRLSVIEEVEKELSK